MAGTYGDAVDLILTDLARADSSITIAVQNEVLKAVEYYSTTRFWFNESQVSFTSSSTIYYPFSSTNGLSNLIEIDHMEANVNGNKVEVLPETFQYLDRIDISGYTGYPARYAIYNNQFRLYPKPNAVYQIDVAGQFRLTTLSASTDSNAWTTDAVNLIAARVEATLSARRWKDYQAAQTYQIVEQNELARLLARTDRLLASGRLSPND